MQIKNTSLRFGMVAISLHWLMALLIVMMIVIGLTMVRLPVGLSKLKLFGWHKEWGMVILMLATVRLSWRIININPTLNPFPRWERITATCVHRLFYFFMFALPITGWLITSAADLRISFFGWFLLPNLIAPSETFRLLFSDVHEWLAYSLIAMFCLHVMAAFKHHFIDKDDVLRRML